MNVSPSFHLWLVVWVVNKSALPSIDRLDREWCNDPRHLFFFSFPSSFFQSFLREWPLLVSTIEVNILVFPSIRWVVLISTVFLPLSILAPITLVYVFSFPLLSMGQQYLTLCIDCSRWSRVEMSEGVAHSSNRVLFIPLSLLSSHHRHNSSCPEWVRDWMAEGKESSRPIPPSLSLNIRCVLSLSQLLDSYTKWDGWESIRSVSPPFLVPFPILPLLIMHSHFTREYLISCNPTSLFPSILFISPLIFFILWPKKAVSVSDWGSLKGEAKERSTERIPLGAQFFRLCCCFHWFVPNRSLSLFLILLTDSVQSLFHRWNSSIQPFQLSTFHLPFHFQFFVLWYDSIEPIVSHPIHAATVSLSLSLLFLSSDLSLFSISSPLPIPFLSSLSTHTLLHFDFVVLFLVCLHETFLQPRLTFSKYSNYFYLLFKVKIILLAVKNSTQCCNPLLSLFIAFYLIHKKCKDVIFSALY